MFTATLSLYWRKALLAAMEDKVDFFEYPSVHFLEHDREQEQVIKINCQTDMPSLLNMMTEVID